jgi:hypothetical protein
MDRREPVEAVSDDGGRTQPVGHRPAALTVGLSILVA